MPQHIHSFGVFDCLSCQSNAFFDIAPFDFPRRHDEESNTSRIRRRSGQCQCLGCGGWGKPPAFAAIEGAHPLEQDEVAEAITGLVAQLRAGK